MTQTELKQMLDAFEKVRVEFMEDPAKARALLIEEGFTEEDGKLTNQFGRGPTQKAFAF
jgi:hypothetical protein